MKRWSAKSALQYAGAAALLWAVVAGACLFVGSTTAGRFDIPTSAALSLRLERVWVASLVGAALAGAGVAYQSILRNPLADPYLLGVSSGASLAGYLWQFAFAAGIAAALSQQAASFVGAAVSVVVVFGVAGRRGRLDPVTLLLTGVIVNALNASLFLLINALIKDPPGAGGPISFIVGGIRTNLTSHQMIAAAVIVAGGWILLWSLSGQLAAAALGDAEIESLGISIQRLRWIALGIASLITAAAVAVSGPIGFVGLVCPHLARRFVGPDPRRLLPVATALGAALLALADAATRYLAGPSRAATVLPVGVLTGLLGGPFFLFLLLQGRRSRAPHAGGLS